MIPAQDPDVTNPDARIFGGNRAALEVLAADRDTDDGALVARGRADARDSRCANATGRTRDGPIVANGVVGVDGNVTWSSITWDRAGSLLGRMAENDSAATITSTFSPTRPAAIAGSFSGCPAV